MIGSPSAQLCVWLLPSRLCCVIYDIVGFLWRLLYAALNSEITCRSLVLAVLTVCVYVQHILNPPVKIGHCWHYACTSQDLSQCLVFHAKVYNMKGCPLLSSHTNNSASKLIFSAVCWVLIYWLDSSFVENAQLFIWPVQYCLRPHAHNLMHTPATLRGLYSSPESLRKFSAGAHSFTHYVVVVFVRDDLLSYRAMWHSWWCYAASHPKA